MKKYVSLSTLALICAVKASVWAEEVPDLPEVPPRDQGMWQTFVMIGIALAFFYLILWRPEQKRRKQMDELRTSLKKGDRVTAMGIIGTVVKVQEHTVILKMYDGSKVEFLKAAISDVSPGSDEDIKKIESEE